MNNKINQLDFFEEPLLEFANKQKSDYCKDGLFLYGPLVSKPDISYGIIGHKEGIERFEKWMKDIQNFIPAKDNDKLHFSPFIGFNPIFNTNFRLVNNAKILINQEDINNTIRLDNKNKAIYETVDLYKNKLVEFSSNEDESPNLWFVIIPEIIYQWGRVQSSVPKDEQIASNMIYSKKIKSKQVIGQIPLLNEFREQAVVYDYGTDFRRQLKARLLKDKISIQIVRETTIAPNDFLDKNNNPIRHVQDQATTAWNLSTTALYKSGCQPWKLADIRKGVCYIGLVFKKLDKYTDLGNACCGAQMFLDTGDGLVFKGAIGNWHNETTNEYHLTKGKAKELMKSILDEYYSKQGNYPTELFIHGKTYFNNDEWKGFQEASEHTETKLIGIRIRQSCNELKLYRLNGTRPIVRGTAFKVSDKKAYLWTTGYVERFNTYPGFNVPNPISIEICQGNADLNTVIKDIFALTKINFNSCNYGDSVPVTLNFADAVGDILTAAPKEEVPPLPFKFYI